VYPENLETHLCTQITLEPLAGLVHLSPFHFARCFKANTGLAPHQYVIARCMELAKRLVLTSMGTVAEIAWAIGYENISHFRRVFALHTGLTPGVIRCESQRSLAHFLQRSLAHFMRRDSAAGSCRPATKHVSCAIMTTMCIER
jgi:AraC-like DNA-binding protein